MNPNYSLPIANLLSDETILATGQDGKELLHFTYEVAGKTLRFRYPRHGQWDEYYTTVYSILKRLNLDEYDLLLPTDQDRVLKPTEWADLAADIMMQKRMQIQIEETFWRFLDPRFDGMDVKESRVWFDQHAPMYAIVDMLVALLNPDQHIKKKTSSQLLQNYRHSTAQRWGNSQPNGDGPTGGNKPKASSQFASFS